VVDDFLPPSLFEAVQQFARTATYGTVEYQGHQFAGVARDTDFGLQEMLQQLTGEALLPMLSYFRLGLANEPPEARNAIHADTSVDAEFATVLYLADPRTEAGGTAFWRHPWLGRDTVPDNPPAALVDRLNRDGLDWSKWEPQTMVAEKSNRLLIYPTRYFHSRWPQQGRGTSPADGRLVHVGFFNEAFETEEGS
jgi:hypothetical protein